jgi:hypothetical protein
MHGVARLVQFQALSRFSPSPSGYKIIVKDGTAPEVLEMLDGGAHAVFSSSST